MRHILLGLLLLCPWAAQADVLAEVPARFESQKIKFFYSSNSSAYACDYMESQAEKYLEFLGAQDIKVRCTGGLPFDLQLNARIEFKSIASADESEAELVGHKTRVEILVDESCDFNELLVRRLLKGFEVSKVKTRGSCRDSQGQIKFSIDLLK